MKCWKLQSDLAPSPLALRTLSPALYKLLFRFLLKMYTIAVQSYSQPCSVQIAVTKLLYRIAKLSPQFPLAE